MQQILEAPWAPEGPYSGKLHGASLYAHITDLPRSREIWSAAMHTTRPEGYESNYAALLDLIRFGFGIWTPAQMAVLLFHAERSTIYGKHADQHSEAQARHGVFSKSHQKWIRGPIGVSTATWHRINAGLSKTGTIKRARRTDHQGSDKATEYAIDWLEIRAQLETIKNAPSQKPRRNPRLTR